MTRKTKARKLSKSEEVAKVLIYGFVGLWSIILLLIAAVILNDGLGFSSLIISFCFLLLVGAIIVLRNKIWNFIKRHQRVAMVICALAIIVGVLLRLSFVLVGDQFSVKSTLTDTGVHWGGATMLVEDGQLDETIGVYENFFPYLTSYTSLLGMMMKIFGVGYNTVVISNTVFDIIAMIIIFVLFLLWKKDKRAGLLAAAVWAINPLQIIFCSVPMAIVITNTLLLLVILLVYLLYNHDMKRKWLNLIVALICGIVLAIGNVFRPIFAVFLIAIIVTYLVLVLKKNIRIWSCAVGCAVLLMGYFLTGIMLQNIFSSVNPYFVKSDNNVGWSVFVGANYERSGRWSADDSNIFFGEVLESVNGDTAEAQDKILKMGFYRYHDLLLRGRLLDHTINKAAVLFSDVENSIGDFRDDFRVEEKPGAAVPYQIVQNLILIFYLSLVIVVGCFTVWMYRNGIMKYYERNKFILYLLVVFIGLFAVSLLVEVMNRYCLPFVALLIILTVNAVWDMGKRKSVN